MVSFSDVFDTSNLVCFVVSTDIKAEGEDDVACSALSHCLLDNLIDFCLITEFQCLF